MEIKTIKLSEIKPASYNPRKISKKDYDNLKKEIKEFGFLVPLIINKDKTLVGGHQRLKVLKDLGYKEVEVITVNLNKEKERILNIALNKNVGEWDINKLIGLLTKIDNENLALSGFDKIDLDVLLNNKTFLEKEFNEHLKLKNVCPKCKYSW